MDKIHKDPLYTPWQYKGTLECNLLSLGDTPLRLKSYMWQASSQARGSTLPLETLRVTELFNYTEKSRQSKGNK